MDIQTQPEGNYILLLSQLKKFFTMVGNAKHGLDEGNFRVILGFTNKAMLVGKMSALQVELSI